MTCTSHKSPGYFLACLTVAYNHRIYVAADEITDWPGCQLTPGQPARLQNGKVTCVGAEAGVLGIQRCSIFCCVWISDAPGPLLHFSPLASIYLGEDHRWGPVWFVLPTS